MVVPPEVVMPLLSVVVPEVETTKGVPMLLFDGTLNEKADVEPFFSVYQLPLL